MAEELARVLVTRFDYANFVSTISGIPRQSGVREHRDHSRGRCAHRRQSGRNPIGAAVYSDSDPGINAAIRRALAGIRSARTFLKRSAVK